MRKIEGKGEKRTKRKGQTKGESVGWERKGKRITTKTNAKLPDLPV
jgi:hypothetical protein